MVLILEFEGTINHEETTWRQKSRTTWLKERDINTRFFHKIANAHWRFNTIDKLKINDMVVNEPKEVKKS